MTIDRSGFLPYILYTDKSISPFIPLRIFLICTGLMSLMTFVIYGIDKARSKVTDPKKRRRRVPERVLLTLAFAGGAPGAAAAMLLFHHKTRKRRFVICVPIALTLWLAVLLYTVYLGIMGGYTV